MQNSNLYNSRTSQSRYYKILKRKVFFSNELKKTLLLACYEAQAYQTYVTLDLLIYGLVSQPKSLSSRLILSTMSQFHNNNTLTSKVISDRIRKINQQSFRENLSNRNSSLFSLELLKENRQTPWLTSEVKEILRSAVNSALQSRKKIVIVNTKHLLFCLLNQEYIRDLIRNLIN